MIASSWNDGPRKQAIVDFVKKVTEENGPDYVRREDRIATFDNDGNLWAEQPGYIMTNLRAMFALPNGIVTQPRVAASTSFQAEAP
jgi:hypothetical protein